MENEDVDIVNVSNYEESHSAVNSLILDYYKKFGKKRDLEQFFSLSTAQSEVRDPCSLFWRRMKAQDESSDSGGKKSESSTELCRISIQCSIPEPSGSQITHSRCKSDSESPPIISEDVISEPVRNSDNESVKSDDLHSQKSIDGTLDLSTNKPLSPTSSITSQRKLEWDSLADVGYANESDRKNSASSLSTLERMALHQQYSYNDTKNTDLGQPTAQSTPFDVDESKSKTKKGLVRKTTKICKTDIDSVKLSVSQISDTKLQPINLNLTKHISFNVDKNGSVVVENTSKNISLSPEKVSVETAVTPQIKMDKEIQTTLGRNKEKSQSSGEVKNTASTQVKRYPVLISLNTLKKRTRKKKARKSKRQKNTKKCIDDKENLPLEKSGDQLSEAESFEYMPGHIYNQNNMKNNQHKTHTTDNKSSLESSGITTDSSKTTKYSFSKDLEKSIDILKSTVDSKYEDANLRRILVKEIVQKLVESQYKGDKSSTEFLSGLSFNSKRLDLGDFNYTTTSTSDANNTANKSKLCKPKKSILRMDKFNTNAVASTSQSVPNIPIFTKNEKSIKSKSSVEFSNTDSDVSYKNKALSDVYVDKTTSEELYKKYLEALKREQAYKKHLKDKEMFLKQKLVNNDAVFNISRQVDSKTQNKIKDLMKDLVRNNYDDGSGDASKLEGITTAHDNFAKYNSIQKQRSHSVFTLSSGNSEKHYKNGGLSNKQNEAGTSMINKMDKHYCCCPFHSLHPKVGVTDSSVQVNIKPCQEQGSSDRYAKESLLKYQNIREIEPLTCQKCISQRNKTQILADSATDNIKYLCLCTEEAVEPQEIPENFLIYKCSRLPNKNLKLEDIISKVSNTVSRCSSNSTSPRQKPSSFVSQDCENKCLVIKDSNSSNNQTSKSSQTNLNLPICLKSKSSQRTLSSSSSEIKLDNVIHPQNMKKNTVVHEATRCIQTEISIDPKKSDPSLTDINIINDKNCVNLISQQCKKVTQPNLDNNVNEVNKYCCKMQSSNSSLTEGKRKLQTESVTTCVDRSTNTAERIDKEVQSISDHISNNNSEPVGNKQCPNNFTIPIQGTNMTLKVSLGSGSNNSPCAETKYLKDFKNMNLTSVGTETVKNAIVENSTSLQEECSKAVQSNETKIVEELNKNPKTTCCGSKITESDNVNSEVHTNERFNLSSKPLVNTCITTGYKYNTFPTEAQSHVQKPLLRSNTDPSKIEKCHVTFHQKTIKDTGVKTNDSITPLRIPNEISSKQGKDKGSCCSETSSKSIETSCKSKVNSGIDNPCTTSCSEIDANVNLHETQNTKDPLLDIIQGITKRYSKKDFEKSRRKKCFKEIITVLNYLLDTEESTDHDQNKASCSSACDDVCEIGETLPEKDSSGSIPPKILVDKAVQLTTKKSKSYKTCTESSDIPITTDLPSTSSDSATCKVLNKIKKECEKYHQKRCKLHTGKRCEVSSSTSVNCDQCRRVHYCSCRGHKCKGHRTKTTVEKTKRRCVAYNLIIQTSDSIVSEEINCGNNQRPLKNIIVKVPSKRKVENVPFKEMVTKIERDMPHCNVRCNTRAQRSKSLPNDSEISSTDDIMKKACTVRDFLEKNRPDFIAKCSNRQDCLKSINEAREKEGCTPRLNMIVVHPPTCNGNSCMDTCNMYCGGVPINNCNSCPYNSVHCVQKDLTRIAKQRAAKRQLLSLQLDGKDALDALSESDLRFFARELGGEFRRKKVAPKFISEREMKKHSEKIYKSLPEVVCKREEIKKENIKRTNLLMANIFKKNLQKKTLSGAINISNYSTVIKI